MLLSISHRSQIVAAPLDVLNERVPLWNTIATAKIQVAHALKKEMKPDPRDSNGKIKACREYT